MKRLIKYYNQFQRLDRDQFSNCGTKYEILPYLVEDNAGNKELIAFADALGYERKGNIKTYENKRMTHAVKLNEIETREYACNTEKYQVYLGFVTLSKESVWQGEGILTPVESIKTPMTNEQAHEIVCNQMYGVDNIIEMNDSNDNKTMLVMSGHDYFHEINLLGYDLDQFQELNKIDEITFYDEVFTCGDCGKGEFNDSGYTYNYRIVDCTQLGLNCGCYHNNAKENYKDMTNDSDKCIELDVAKELEEEGQLEFIERFIGGMTDGRGGSYGGKSTSEGTPKGILKELLKKNPKNEYIFTHDESGQFQTYFSVWQIIPQIALVG